MSKVTFTLVFLFAVLPSFVDTLGHLRGTKKDSASTLDLTACCSGSDDEDFSDDDGGDSTTATTTTTESVCVPEVVNPPLNKRFYGHYLDLNKLYGVQFTTKSQAMYKDSRLDAQTSRAGWVPQVKDNLTCCKSDPWMILDLGSIRKVRGVITQGASGSDPLWKYWTKKFKVSYSRDDKTYYSVDGGKLFAGNTNTWKRKKNNFGKDIDARYIVFKPKLYGAMISMRAGVIVCK